MKIEQQKQEFQPVVITLESEQDKADMIYILGAAFKLWETPGMVMHLRTRDSANNLLNTLLGKTTIA